jgi:hypothetical protein
MQQSGFVLLYVLVLLASIGLVMMYMEHTVLVKFSLTVFLLRC